MDVGNSGVKTRAWSAGAGLLPGGRWPADAPPDLDAMFAGRVDAVVMASVVPTLGSTIAAMSADRGLRMHMVTPGAAEVGVLVHGLYEGMGPDRVADVIALAGLYPLPAIVVDAGTAVTLDLVADGGCYVGGMIVPGPRLMIRALAQGTALLQEVKPHGDGAFLATDTASAVAGGAFWGSICMIDGLLRLAESRGYGWRSLVVTGGGAGDVSRGLTREHVVDRDLCFKGMVRVWQSLHSGTDAR